MNAIRIDRVKRRIYGPPISFVSFVSDPEYSFPAGWWFRLFRDGPGIRYADMSTGDWVRFSERQGFVRTYRVGRHKFALLRPIRKRKGDT